MKLEELVHGTLSIGSVTYDDWLGGRGTKVLSTNFGSEAVAFQSWRNFKEAFAPELIGQAYEETSRVLGRQVKNCIDPFGGSGTTALACQFLGVSPTTIEVNPFLADLIEAKLTSYDIDLLISDFLSVVELPLGIKERPLPGLPPTFVEPGVKERYIFNLSVASALHIIRDRINSINNVQNRRLMLVLLGAMSLPVSNVIVSGKGRRYRKKWKENQACDRKVLENFSEAVIKAIFDIRRFADRSNKGFSIIRGDSRHAIPTDKQFDMAVFSPPYPNSFDYTDVYNIELWLCGYLKDSTQNKKLRKSTLRSHVQVAQAYDVGQLKSRTLDGVYSHLSEIKDSLWSKNIPEMVRAYFDDMNQIIQQLHSQLIPQGRVYMVVGDSQYAGVKVPVSKILNELSTAAGFQVVAMEPFRSMRASPQQGGKLELLETLITLSRD